MNIYARVPSEVLKTSLGTRPFRSSSIRKFSAHKSDLSLFLSFSQYLSFPRSRYALAAARSAAGKGTPNPESHLSVSPEVTPCGPHLFSSLFPKKDRAHRKTAFFAYSSFRHASVMNFLSRREVKRLFMPIFRQNAQSFTIFFYFFLYFDEFFVKIENFSSFFCEF